MATAAPSSPSPPIAASPLRDSLEQSSTVWQQDLKSLFEHAKERFSDVAWETSDDTAEGGLIKESDVKWGHKAIVYARAPPAFQARYFPSGNSLGRSSSPNLMSSSSVSLTSSFRANSPSLSVPSTNNNKNPSYIANSNSSQFSLASNVSSASTIRQPNQPLRLKLRVTPQLFESELEWLYTGEGMGQLVEWLNERGDTIHPPNGESDVVGLGIGVGGAMQGGNNDAKQERLRNDLVYMWRSKLYSDLKLTVKLSTVPANGNASTISLQSTADGEFRSTFSVHKFILASRSPYFAQILLNPGGYKKREVDEIELPSPPFTAASLHFCLGYMYAGTLAFSNRTYDLTTAFQIHRSASYLNLPALRAEIETRITYEMCSSLDPNVFTKLLARRVPRVWRFAMAVDVGAKSLELKARVWMVRWWSEWGKEVGEVGKRERDSLVKEVLQSLKPSTAVSFVRNISSVRDRVDSEFRGTGLASRAKMTWADSLLSMILEIEAKTRSVLCGKFADVIELSDFQSLLEMVGFGEAEVLEKVLDEVVGGAGSADGCKDAGKVYQLLVGSLLLRIDDSTGQLVLAKGSQTRLTIEKAKTELLKSIKRRWTSIRDKDGFAGLDYWALKEISDEIDVPIEDLTQSSISASPSKQPKSSLRPRASAGGDGTSLRSSVASRAVGLNGKTRESDAASVISTASRATTASRMTVDSKASSSTTTPRPRPSLPTPSNTGSSKAIVNKVASGRVSAFATPGPSTSRSPTLKPSTPTTPTATAQPSRPSSRASASTAPAHPSAVKSPTPTNGAEPSIRRSRPPKVDNAATRKRADSAHSQVSVPTNAASILPSLPPPLKQSKEPTSSSTSTEIPLTSPRKRTHSAASTTASLRPKAVVVPKLPSKASSISARSGMSTPVTPKINAASSKRPSSAASNHSVSSGIQKVIPPTPPPLPTPKINVAISKVSTVAAAIATAEANVASASQKKTASRGLSPSPTASPAFLSTVSPLSTPAPLPMSQAIPPLPSPVIPAPTSPASVPETLPSLVPVSTQSSASSLPPPAANESVESKPRAPDPALLLPPVNLDAPYVNITKKLSRLHPASAFDPPKREQTPPPPSFFIHTTHDSQPVLPSPGITLTVGIPCVVSLSNKRGRCRAFARYIGKLQGAQGHWVGIELAEGLNENSKLEGLNDGSFAGIQYFETGIVGEEWEEGEVQRAARRRRVDGLPLPSSDFFHHLGSKVSSTFMTSQGTKRSLDSLNLEVSKRARSHSPALTDGSSNPEGSSRGLFVRPSAILYVNGAD